jgi:hypothetical protein
MDRNDIQKIEKRALFDRRMMKGTKKEYLKEKRMIITEENQHFRSYDENGTKQ